MPTVGPVLAFVLLTFSLLSQALGQGLQGGEPLIGEITIEFAGVRNVSNQAVLAHIQVREGMERSQNLIDRSIRSLYVTGLFEFIETKENDRPDGTVELVFIVQPKYRISRIRFEGTRKIKPKRLYDEIESQNGGVLDERRLKEDSDTLYEYYLKKGFSDVKIKYEIYRDPSTGFGTIIFQIDEGRKLKISSINFVGNDSFSHKRLKRVAKTKKYNPLLSWLSGGGRFDDAKFQEDLDKLREFYKDKGFLDVAIPDANVTLEYPSSKTIALTINIDEGRQYRLGRISIAGNTLFPTPFLLSVLRLGSGHVFSPSKLDEDSETLSDVYGRLGYLDTRVRAEKQANLASGNIDVTYRVTEGEKTLVEAINISGNTLTKSIVILRELTLAPGETFNVVRMKNSEARLKNTRYFEQVNLSSERTNIPGRRDLKVAVREGRTGDFSVGGGFSSLSKAVMFAEVKQRNFDLFNWRSFFRGDGQSMRIRFQVGSDSSEFILSFREPWLFEKQLEYGFTLFRTESNFVSSVWNERRVGFEVYLRKPLFRLLVGRLGYRWENVDIFNVSPNAPVSIRTEEGERKVSKIAFHLERDTRNSILFPTRGSKLEFISEYAGLGGDTDYTRIMGRGAFFFPTFDLGEQSVAVLGRIGTFSSGGDVPFFDRFFLGGPDDIRGFEFREVGPKDPTTIDPIGGNSMVFGSVEYTFKVSDALRLAMFYDLGAVNPANGDFSLDNYNDSWGFGLRIMMRGLPLSLDYGIPITTDAFNDKGKQFHFNFSSRF